MPMSPRLLRPIASGFHPEAQVWRNAVIANGGTVSGTTFKAVSDFCRSIDTAGLRDRFYRLNLFCGTGLNAALVPLYRGQSRTGTQYGNTTDTNVGPFVSGDYSEAAGLSGNGSSKYLNTGFLANTLGNTDRHLSLWWNSATVTNASRYWLGVDNFSCGNNAFWAIGSNSSTNAQARASQSSTQISITVSSGQRHIILTGNGSATAYSNGSSAGSLSQATFSAPSLAAYVFALNRCDAPADFNSATASCYSIGASMTATQASNFYNILATFQTLLGRV
jgi:hypothetical protein